MVKYNDAVRWWRVANINLVKLGKGMACPRGKRDHEKGGKEDAISYVVRDYDHPDGSHRRNVDILTLRNFSSILTGIIVRGSFGFVY